VGPIRSYWFNDGQLVHGRGHQLCHNRCHNIVLLRPANSLLLQRLPSAAESLRRS
jgi:hypothetical protein